MTEPYDLSIRLPADDMRVGIVTALPVEHAALDVLIDGAADWPVELDHHHYRSGYLPSKASGRPHRVVYGMPTRDGTRHAAALVADMVRSFPRLEVIVVCGIAGGVPRDGEGPGGRSGPHLGDVVVGTEGIIDFGHQRRVDGVSTPRRLVPGISATLLRADRELQSASLRGHKPWLAALRASQARYPGFGRPDAAADPRRRGMPQARDPEVFRGEIGSADVLVRDAEYRDRLAASHAVLAVEMEAVGIANAADDRDKHWFVVRGISDYCENATKSDAWHAYASLAAAAYVRALLAVCPPFPDVSVPQPRGGAVGFHGESGLSAEAEPEAEPEAEAEGARRVRRAVEALARVPVLADEGQRRLVLTLLPYDLRSRIPDVPSDRGHLTYIVEACDALPGGREALLSALSTALGARTAEYREASSVFAEHWPEHWPGR